MSLPILPPISGAISPLVYVNSDSINISSPSGSYIYSGSYSTASYITSSMFSSGSKTDGINYFYSGSSVIGLMTSGSKLTGSLNNGFVLSGSVSRNSTFSGSLSSGSYFSGSLSSGSYFSGSFVNTNGTVVNSSGPLLSGSIFTGSFTSQSFFSGSFPSSSYIYGTFLTNSYVNIAFNTNNTNSYISGTFLSNVLLSGSFSSASYFSGSYISGTFFAYPQWTKLIAHSCKTLYSVNIDSALSMSAIDIQKCPNFASVSLANTSLLTQFTMSNNPNLLWWNFGSGSYTGTVISQYLISQYSESVLRNMISGTVNLYTSSIQILLTDPAWTSFNGLKSQGWNIISNLVEP